jgi:hypothetical protein
MFNPLLVASRTSPLYQYIISSTVFALLLGKTRRHNPSSLSLSAASDGLGLCVKHEKQTGFSFIVFTNEWYRSLLYINIGRIFL